MNYDALIAQFEACARIAQSEAELHSERTAFRKSAKYDILTEVAYNSGKQVGFAQAANYIRELKSKGL